MNPRWQKFVFIATPTIIIFLNFNTYQQRRNHIISQIQEYNLEIPKPNLFLSPSELKGLEMDVSHKVKLYEDKKDLLHDAQKIGLAVEPGLSRIDLEERISTHKKNRLILAVREKQQSLSFEGVFAPAPIESKPNIWNLGLIGLSYTKVGPIEVMQYEGTYASAWLLGMDNTAENGCLFCSIQVSFAKAKELADHLSLSMDLTPCYQQQVLAAQCDGWRLPTKKEWLEARGPIDQKWEYLTVNPSDSSPKTGTVSPNINEIFDIVGNLPEWLSDGSLIGEKPTGTSKTSSVAGFRLYKNYKKE